MNAFPGPGASPPGRAQLLPRGGPRVVDLGFQCTQTRLRPGGEAASTGSNELAEPVLEPLVAEPRLMFFLDDRAVLEERLAHDG